MTSTPPISPHQFGPIGNYFDVKHTPGSKVILMRPDRSHTRYVCLCEVSTTTISIRAPSLSYKDVSQTTYSVIATFIAAFDRRINEWECEMRLQYEEKERPKMTPVVLQTEKYYTPPDAEQVMRTIFRKYPELFL